MIVSISIITRWIKVYFKKLLGTYQKQKKSSLKLGLFVSSLIVSKERLLYYSSNYKFDALTNWANLAKNGAKWWTRTINEIYFCK